MQPESQQEVPAPDEAQAQGNETQGNETRGDEARSDAATIDALEDRLRRAQADLENLRKRHVRELAGERDRGAAEVASAWLPVLDNLDLALSYADADPETIIEGVRAVREQALSVLTALGFPRHEEVGVPFDPARHEVVSVEKDTDAEPGTVLRVLRPGYGEPERQLRPGTVTVAGG